MLTGARLRHVDASLLFSGACTVKFHDGWSYCDADTQGPVLANCDCSDSWWHHTDDCALNHGGFPEKMEGCAATSTFSALCHPDMRHVTCSTCAHACGMLIGARIRCCDLFSIFNLRRQARRSRRSSAASPTPITPGATPRI